MPGRGGVGGGSGAGGGDAYTIQNSYGGAYGSSYRSRFGTRMFQVQRNWFGSRAFDWFHQHTPQLGRHARRPATHARGLQRSHMAQRINALLKSHEALRKSLLRQEPYARSQGNRNGNGVAMVGPQTEDRAADEVQAGGRESGQTVGMAGVENMASVDHAPGAAQNGNDIAAASWQAVDRAPEFQVAAREAGQTVGMASLDRAPDAAQNTAPPSVERTPISRTIDALSVVLVMVMVVVAIGLVGEMRLYRASTGYVRPLELSWQPPNQLEAAPDAASGLELVQKALDTIEQAAAEIVSSRQLRRLS